MPVVLKSNALATLDEVKRHLSIGVANQDDNLRTLINTASQFVESYCRRRLTIQSYTEYQDGRASNRLLLDQWPVIGVPVIAFDQTGKFDGGEEIVDTDRYFVDPRSGDLVFVGGRPPKGYRNIRIEYQAGYGEVDDVEDTNTLPSDLTFACLQLVEWYYRSTTDQRVGQKSKGKNNETVSFETLLPDHIALILQPYIRMEMPRTQVPVRND